MSMLSAHTKTQSLSCRKYQIDECVTLGYIRRVESSLSNACIPNDITNMILQYYLLTDEWDAQAKSEFIIISHNAKGTCVQNIGKDYVNDIMLYVMVVIDLTICYDDLCF
eukprot:159816_1